MHASKANFTRLVWYNMYLGQLDNCENDYTPLYNYMDCFLHVDLYHFYTAGTLSCRIGGTKFISAFQVLEECYIPLSMCMTACMIDCTIALGY